MTGTRHAATESWLDQLGVTWSFDPDLRLSKVDQAASLANQVRHDPLNAEVVERYAAAMNRGDQFPPLLVAPHGDRVAVLGGNHRYAAGMAANRATLPAYVVQASDDVLLRIRVEDNTRHGLPTSMAERVEHAVALMGTGMTQKDAAAVVGVPQPKVSIAASVMAADLRASRLGVDERYRRLPDRTRYAVSQVADEVVFAAVAQFAAEASPPTRTVTDLMRAVNAVEDQDEALRLVGAEAEDHRDRTRGLAGNVRKSSRTARARLDGALAEIIGLNPQAVYDSCPNDDVRAVLAQRVMNAAAVLAPTVDLLLGREP